MKPKNFPGLPMSPKSFVEHPLLVVVRALVLRGSAPRIAFTKRLVANGAKNELTLLALFRLYEQRCSICYGNPVLTKRHAARPPSGPLYRGGAGFQPPPGGFTKGLKTGHCD